MQVQEGGTWPIRGFPGTQTTKSRSFISRWQMGDSEGTVSKYSRPPGIR